MTSPASARSITACCTKNFVVLIGAPGIYDPKDPAHDQSWSNYFVTIQVGFNKGRIKPHDNVEKVHVLVYGEGYTARFNDDLNKKGKNTTQHKQATKYKASHGSYLKRIKTWVESELPKKYPNNEFVFMSVSTPKDVWQYLTTLPDKSLTRFWFCGHASENGLWLNLIHDDEHTASVYIKNIVSLRYQVYTLDNQPKKVPLKDYYPSHDIDTYAQKLAQVADPAFGEVSKFYGCNTSESAQIWNEVTQLKSEGSQEAIDFGVIDRPSSIDDHLERIEQAPVHEKNPGWTEFP